ncbi:MAG: alpha-glucosidase [Spirochaetes bacterium]|nr:MAG: alpha-glucosidase [Spirochaetota bacterium]
MIERTWWKHGVLYQVYPRSFYDSNGDGIGDIPGITQKLDYLAWLGIAGIWLSPVNKSPMLDFGYDISDYRAIDPVFGTMGDFDTLLRESHRREIRIIMDMVMNHTSNLHPWFLESSSSRGNPRRDWYIWHDGRGGRSPNNWRSAFLGSAWEWHAGTGQFYLHSFLKEQPDVNWRNPELRDAMHGEMRFWLDRGVDGFRLDVANWFIKDAKLRSNPFSFYPLSNRLEKYNRNRPESHDIMKGLRRVVDEYGDRMLVGEVFCYPPGDPALSASYLGDGRDELNLAFDFSIMYRRFNAWRYYRCIRKWYNRIPDNGWPCNVFSNHDQPRNYDRHSGAGDADRRARVTAMLLLTLRGTPFLYYGEEIGMRNSRIPRAQIKDPAGRKFWPIYAGRDPARTPMQWSAAINAGFTGGKVWLPVCIDYLDVNVEAQAADRFSLLNFYRSLIELRNRHGALSHGNWKPLVKGLKGIFAFTRTYREEKLCVVLNFTRGSTEFHAGKPGQWKVLFSTHRSSREHFTELRMRMYPYEGTILEKIGELK